MSERGRVDCRPVCQEPVVTVWIRDVTKRDSYWLCRWWNGHHGDKHLYFRRQKSGKRSSRKRLWDVFRVENGRK